MAGKPYVRFCVFWTIGRVGWGGVGWANNVQSSKCCTYLRGTFGSAGQR